MSIEQCRGSSKNWEERMVEANAAPKKVGRRGGTDKRIAKKNRKKEWNKRRVDQKKTKKGGMEKTRGSKKKENYQKPRKEGTNKRIA